MEIHLFWEGPYSIVEINKLNDINFDYGIYQAYGFHSLYGKDVLLYIGKANQQTFFKRLKQEYWNYYQDPKNVKIYVGRIANKDHNDNKWETKIDLAEKLLIYSHNPVQNTVNKNSVNFDELRDVHIFNWENRRDLFPEVSWKRWSDQFNDLTEDDIIGLEE